jgi:hypothetical protein
MIVFMLRRSRPANQIHSSDIPASRQVAFAGWKNASHAETMWVGSKSGMRLYSSLRSGCQNGLTNLFLNMPDSRDDCAAGVIGVALHYASGGGYNHSAEFSGDSL